MKKAAVIFLSVLILIVGVIGCNHNDDNTSGKLVILDNLDIDQLFYCSDNTIIFGKSSKYYLSDHSGNILTSGYDEIKCANSDGYFVAYNYSSSVIEENEDPDYGKLNTVRTVTDCYVINENGKIAFSTQYISVEVPMGSTTYEGEFIASCNENRIITYTSDTYNFASSHSPLTVNIYTMDGERITQFTDVRSVGTLINGELILITDDNRYNVGFIQVADSNGNILRYNHECMSSFTDFPFFPNDEWVSNGFINGYALIIDRTSNEAALISKDLTKSYIVNSKYLANYSHIGSLVASKIITDGNVSENYYLVDLTKCKTDENGYCIPTLDSVVSKHGYDDMYFSCLFGDTEPYILISQDGKWGYLTIDDGTEIMYTDAGKFYNGKAIVLDDDGIYVINEEFSRISNIINGYSSVSSYTGNVFCLRNGDKLTVAVYSE